MTAPSLRGLGAAASQINGGPGGIRTRDLDLERVASLARLDDGVPGPLCVRNGSGMIAGPWKLDNRTPRPKRWQKSPEGAAVIGVAVHRLLVGDGVAGLELVQRARLRT